MLTPSIGFNHSQAPASESKGAPQNQSNMQKGFFAIIWSIVSTIFSFLFGGLISMSSTERQHTDNWSKAISAPDQAKELIQTLKDKIPDVPNWTKEKCLEEKKEVQRQVDKINEDKRFRLIMDEENTIYNQLDKTQASFETAIENHLEEI